MSQRPHKSLQSLCFFSQALKWLYASLSVIHFHNGSSMRRWSHRCCCFGLLEGNSPSAAMFPFLPFCSWRWSAAPDGGFPAVSLTLSLRAINPGLGLCDAVAMATWVGSEQWRRRAQVCCDRWCRGGEGKRRFVQPGWAVRGPCVCVCGWESLNETISLITELSRCLFLLQQPADKTPKQVLSASTLGEKRESKWHFSASCHNYKQMLSACVSS